MSPKAKPHMAPKKPATKKTTGESKANVMPPPAAKPTTISHLSIKATNPFTVAYYANGAQDYANVAIRVNGTIKREEFDV